MPRTTHTTTTARKPGLMSRLRARPARRREAKVTTKHSKNPITGTHKTTRTTETHPNGLGHHGHGGRGPMASSSRTHHTTTTAAPVHHQRRKPSMGDKLVGGLKRTFARSPGKKVHLANKDVGCWHEENAWH
ncbi:uncharacterized protein LTR77_004406 [Saxophila tyrrhenica]|uniref:Uncharacterized protein n=1 Tax=Saxophila tyrrhenica TaxID=1690608 RepID=A0AAV9PFL1_9PEZI|nr:hypothetical protein LTR77_004406 [Saxophila tyrrhenica]